MPEEASGTKKLVAALTVAAIAAFSYYFGGLPGAEDLAPSDAAAPSEAVDAALHEADVDCKNIDAVCQEECASLGFWDCAGYHVSCLAGDHTACCFVAMCDGDCQTDCVSSCDCTGTPPGPPPGPPPGAAQLPFGSCPAPALDAATPKNSKAYCEAECPKVEWYDCIGYDLACGEEGVAAVCCWASVCDSKLFGGDSACVSTCQTCESLEGLKL